MKTYMTSAQKDSVDLAIRAIEATGWWGPHACFSARVQEDPRVVIEMIRADCVWWDHNMDDNPLRYNDEFALRVSRELNDPRYIDNMPADVKALQIRRERRCRYAARYAAGDAVSDDSSDDYFDDSSM